MDFFVYGIYLDSVLIGFINNTDISNDEIELDYVIDPNYQNNGYATEAVRASIDALFGIGFKTIKIGAFEENIASIRLMEKCNLFKIQESEMIEYRNKKHNCVYYKIEKN